MKKEHYKYVFGPVPSRRLGHSLGIDLTPYKTCSFDCVYCQLGVTTLKTIERKEYVPLDEVIFEIKSRLNEKQHIDYITLAGSGEPTLYSRLGELIENIKNLTNIPVAVLTNGSLLWDKELQKELEKADLVVPSLDAGNSNTFLKVNRPFKDLSFEQVIKGIIDFSKIYKNDLWLEILFVEGINDSDQDVKDIARYCEIINPDKIQLNTVVRPPCELSANYISEDRMKEILKFFKDKAEIITDFTSVFKNEETKITEQDIINLLERRPCTLNDIEKGLNIHKNEIIKHLTHLKQNKKIKLEQRNNLNYYSITKDL